MIKRILAGAAAAGLALTLVNAGSATAECTTGNSGPAADRADIQEAPGGTTLYKSPGEIGGTSGYVGVEGPRGYIEGSGGPSGGSLSGQSTVEGAPAQVDGRITGSTDGAAPEVCVNGQGN